MTIMRHWECEFPLPPGWEDRSSVVAVAPSTDGFQPNLVLAVDSLDAYGTLESFVRRSFTRTREAFENDGDLVLIDEGLIAIGHRSTYRQEYVIRMHAEEHAGKAIRQIQFFILVGSKVYSATFSDLDVRFELTKGIAEKVISQLRITPADGDHAYVSWQS